MIKSVKVILEEDGRLRPLETICPPGDGVREFSIIVLLPDRSEDALGEEDFVFVEGISQDALKKLWEDEEEDVWGNL